MFSTVHWLSHLLHLLYWSFLPLQNPNSPLVSWAIGVLCSKPLLVLTSRGIFLCPCKAFRVSGLTLRTLIQLWIDFFPRVRDKHIVPFFYICYLFYNVYFGMIIQKSHDYSYYNDLCAVFIPYCFYRYGFLVILGFMYEIPPALLLTQVVWTLWGLFLLTYDF